MKYMFFDNQCYHHLTQIGESENWVGIAGVITGILGVLIALVAIFFVCSFRYKDRKRENDFDKKTKNLLFREIHRNEDIIANLLLFINNLETNNIPIPELRFLEDKVFYGMINSSRIVRVINEDSMDIIFELYNTIATANNVMINALNRMRSNILHNNISEFNPQNSKNLKKYLVEAKEFINNPKLQ